VGAGAAWTERASAHNKDLAGKIAEAIQFEGFSLLDIWGVCPGRYTKKNPLTPSQIQSSLAKLPDLKNAAEQNRRKEFVRHYGELALTSGPAQKPVEIEVTCSGPDLERQSILIAGKAGQRVITAGELLGLAAMSAGFYVTQKNDYPITVLRGHSVSELIVSKEPVGYTGISRPDIVLVLAEEGVNRKRSILEKLGEDTLIVKAASVELPASEGMVENIDYKAMNIKPADRALAALAVLANRKRALTGQMLKTSLTLRFSEKALASSLEVVHRVEKYFS
jgi:Pyruvate/2-oxoacid:ferredoxin oxidoreductase gamma subunit